MASSVFHRRVPVLLALAAVLTLVTAQIYYEDKRNEGPNQRPFYLGSRYGRSDQTAKVVVAPRNDRFFMGSRYGKRGIASDLLARDDHSLARTLKCTSTGLHTIYRCVPDEISDTKMESSLLPPDETASDSSAASEVI